MPRWNLGVQELTDRDRRILELASYGKTNKEIAEALNVSPATPLKDLSEIYYLLGAKNRAHAVAIALRGGIIQ